MKITIEDQVIVGTPEKAVQCLEAAGYAAVRANENPHYFWQYGEFIKRENLCDKSIQRRSDLPRGRRARRNGS